MGFVVMIFFGHVVVAACNWCVPRASCSTFWRGMSDTLFLVDFAGVPAMPAGMDCMLAGQASGCQPVDSHDVREGCRDIFTVRNAPEVLDSSGLMGLQIFLLAPNSISVP